MAQFFIVLTAAFAVATLVTLLVGVFAMGKAGAFNQKHSNTLMRLRVIFQLLTVGCLVLAMFAYQAG